MRYVALACDYDGTLAHDGTVDDETIVALECLRESGRKLLLVTGRELDELARVFPRLDLFDRVVAENGALLYRPATREELMSTWEQAWSIALAALASLSDADLTRETNIRGERHSVMQAIHRQVAHYAYHCGQIVFLAKHLQHENWKSLTIPRGGSASFARRVAEGEASQR